MIEWTTPGCTGPCPACRAKGLPWHPNGQWRWSPSAPDQLTCSVCRTVFPNEFPESVVVECRWGRGQKFSYVGGDTFECFGYRQARPSISGIIRGRKVSHMTGLAEHPGDGLLAHGRAAVRARRQGHSAPFRRSVSGVLGAGRIRVRRIRRHGSSCGRGAHRRPPGRRTRLSSQSAQPQDLRRLLGRQPHWHVGHGRRLGRAHRRSV